MKRLIPFAFLMLSSAFLRAQASEGYLMIVGGALADDNKLVYERMLNTAGGAEKVKIAIIPSASGSPVSSAEAFINACERYGVKRANCSIVPLATEDDEDTKEVNESTWATNGNETTVVNMIKNADFVWFTGGDQMRTMRVLKPDGIETKAFKALFTVLDKGGIIGGSSAGAAIQSDVMIGGGSSIGSLSLGTTDQYRTQAEEASGILLLTKGCGFFTDGIIDQHFDRKARLGRLIVANWENREKYPLGFGIDENTGLFVDRKARIVEVVGAAGVSIIDVTQAQSSRSNEGYTFNNVEVSLLENGDKLLLSTMELQPQALKKPASGEDSDNIRQEMLSGAMSSFSSTVHDLLTYSLIDNYTNQKVENYTFLNQNKAFRLVFSKTPNTKGFYTALPDDGDHYTVWRVRCDIEPVSIEIIKK